MSALRYRSSVIALALVALLGTELHAVAGDEIAAVTGRVTLDGKPLPGGRILLHLEDGQFVGAKIDKNGNFKMDRVLVGKHTVTIEFKGVPEKYASEENSGLRVEVANGENVFEFALIK